MLYRSSADLFISLELVKNSCFLSSNSCTFAFEVALLEVYLLNMQRNIINIDWNDIGKFITLSSLTLAFNHWVWILFYSNWFTPTMVIYLLIIQGLRFNITKYTHVLMNWVEDDIYKIL